MSIAEPAELTGCQEPVFCTVPPFAQTSGDEAADLMALAGIGLLPWQRLVLRGGLGEKEGGRWSAFEVAPILARQNGKNVVLEARELAGLFLLKERLILHTAHEFKTAQEAFRRVDRLVTDYDWFRRQVKRVNRTHGEEAVELLSGARLRFIARSKASGRGFSADCVILDEAYELGDDAMSALLPTMSALPNPQLWYASSAGMPTSVQLGRIWRRIIRAAKSGVADRSLAGYVWQANLCGAFCPPDCSQHDRPDDPATWAKANPSLGAWLPAENRVLLSAEHIAHEMSTMSPADFARERLSVGDYPPDAAETWAVISEDAWRRLGGDPQSQAQDPLAFGVDMKPDRAFTAISAAGQRPDGRIHIEVIEHKPGADWVPARVAELWRKWRPCAVVVDPRTDAGALIEAIEQARAEVVQVTARDVAQACGQFYDQAIQGRLAYRDAPLTGRLTAAVAGATSRRLSDAWAWDRQAKNVDISPLVSATLATWGFNKFGRPRFAPYDLVRSVG